MKFLLILIAIAISLFTHAQSLDETKLLGTWTAIEIETTPFKINQGNQVIKNLKNILYKSTYTFDSKGKFKLILKNNSSDFMSELNYINNLNWKLDQNNTHISIGTAKDKFSLMGLFIITKGNEIFFQIEESPFLMNVKKATIKEFRENR